MKPARSAVSQFSYLVTAAALAASGCAGQSGNEGSLPSAPCAHDETVAVGRIEMLGGGCVRVLIERVVTKPEADNGQVIPPRRPEPGTTVAGKLRATYAWRHEFKERDPVAV